MGLFKRPTATPEVLEPSFSREWLASTPMSRKTELSLTVVARTVGHEASSLKHHGNPLEGALQEGVAEIVREVGRQDRSLMSHLSRDTVLLFEMYGGVFMNQDAAIEVMGIRTGSSGSGADALAIARVIQGRSQGLAVSPDDEQRYVRHFEDASEANFARAVGIAAWAATAVGRLHVAGHLASENEIYLGHVIHRTMSGDGWYPNPVNAGDTSRGDAQIERWWDGNDWADRVRFRDGRRWNEAEQSLFIAPSN